MKNILFGLIQLVTRGFVHRFFLCIVVLFLLSAFFPPSEAHASKFSVYDKVEVYNTGGVGLRLRQWYSTTSSIVTKMPDGTQMTVYGGPYQADGYNWWYLYGYVDGSSYGYSAGYYYGYAAEDYLKLVSASCTYYISPSSQSFDSNGGSGNVSVTTSSGCSWTATSNTSWITITSGSSVSGNGTVNYSVASNSSTSSRTGTMTIAGQTFTVTQSPASSPPTVTTGTYQTASSSSVQLFGTVNPNGLTTTGWFEWGTTSSYGNTTNKESLGSGTGVVQMLHTISGLTASTTYHFRAVAQSSAGTSYGEDMSFTTEAPAATKPTVTTNAATSVTSTTAMLNGTVNPNGAATTGWFEWGTTSSYGNTTQTFSGGSGTSDVTMSWSISSLSPNTTYHFRAVGQNSAGTSYGYDMSFTTSSGGVQPTVTTGTYQTISSSSVQLFGTVNPNGLSTTGWFQWGTTASYGNKTNEESLGSGTSVVQMLHEISGLSASTTYHFRAVGKNSSGTSYGDDMSFTTEAPAATKPTVTTNAATSVSSTTATLNGIVNPNGASTTGWFEWGTTASYGNTTQSFSGGSGTNDVAMSWSVSGLSPNTTYHFRAVGQNSAGTTYGSDMTFTTSLTSGTPSPTATPTASPTPTTIIPKIAAGGYHSFALKSGGTVWTWGYNEYGQLGDSSYTNKSTPVKASGLGDITAAAGGCFHSIALKSDGTVYVWGRNNWGQFGDGSNTDRNTPSQLSGLTDVIAVAAGYYDSVFLKSDGTVWTCGGNYRGQLGDGTTTDKYSLVQVSGLSNVTAIAAGRYHSMALKSDGTVWTWGDNTYGQLGDGTTNMRTTPVQVNGLSDVIAIAVGEHYSMSLKSDGTVRTWGYNGDSQLGDGTNTNRSSPVLVSSLSGVAAIAAGEDHGLALKSDGTVWVWGYNNYGQLGDGTFTNKSTPIQVSDLDSVTAISCGYSHSMVMKSDGIVWAWGRNDSGQLGDGTTTNRTTPVQVDINLNQTTTATPTPQVTPTPSPSPSPSPTPIQSSCTDSYEPNDSSSAAYGPLSSSSSYSGKICTDSDADWFALNITSAGTISLNLTVPSSQDYDLELYDPSYSWVAGSTNSTGIGESISYKATITGNYYIKVYGYNGSYNTSDSYTLTYTFTATETPTPTRTSTPTPITTPEEESLLEKYAPILYMHPDEQFHPTNVQTMLDNAKLYNKKKNKKGKYTGGKPVNLKGKKLSLELLMNTKYNSTEYYLKLKDDVKEAVENDLVYWNWKKDQTVYGRKCNDKDEKGSEKTILQYWFFYVYNDWGTKSEFGNSHEGDWEMIQIILGDGNQPEQITYGFHHGGQTYEWSDKEVGKDESGNHPFVYVTLGGHGCWNNKGEHLWYQEGEKYGISKCLKCMDKTDDSGNTLYPENMSDSGIQSSSTKYPYRLENISNSGDSSEYYWINWKGYWGEQTKDKMKGKEDYGSSGPPSPPYINYIDSYETNSRWNKPIKWSNDPVPERYEVCTSENSKVAIYDSEGNIMRLFEKCTPFTIIAYSDKDLVFDVYSLDGNEVDLRISRHRRTGEEYEVEFNMLEISKSGKASFTFSPEQNPTFAIEIDHDRDGFFDSHRLPDFLEVK